MKKKQRAKPIYAYAIKDRGGINLHSIDESRSDVVRRLNRPSGESLILVRISEVDKHPAVSSTHDAGARK